MRVICVDDERLLMEEVVEMCRELPGIDGVQGFTRAKAALAWIEEHEADLALLDIDMPDMNGIALALKIKQIRPDIAIIFLTGYAQYAVDAFAIHASGYLLKPVSQERLAAEVSYALTERQEKTVSPITIRTFGEFDLLIDDRPVAFPRAKAKELLAYLVDRQGASVSRKTLFAALWEDEGIYDRSRQKYLDVIIRSLRDTLAANGAEKILEMKNGMLRVCPETFSCDVYRFFDGDPDAINAFRGEYMSAYTWASMSEAYVEQSKRKGSGTA